MSGAGEALNIREHRHIAVQSSIKCQTFLRQPRRTVDILLDLCNVPAPDRERMMGAISKGTHDHVVFDDRMARESFARISVVVGWKAFRPERDRLVQAHALADLEINPLIVGAAGQGVRAVDIRPVRA